MKDKITKEITIGCLKVKHYESGKIKMQVLKRENWKVVAPEINRRLLATGTPTKDGQTAWEFKSYAELEKIITQKDPLFSAARNLTIKKMN